MDRIELQRWLVSAIGTIAPKSPRPIETRERFNQYGLDSIAATRLVAELSAKLGRPCRPRSPGNTPPSRPSRATCPRARTGHIWPPRSLRSPGG
ncbi:acyl carrier protein [Nannocystis pusilla]|uniref:acyl carrier protein n=1 Tax=Nannocystis pusilla TaxID=889268 RepID=UPI003B7C7BD9